MDKGAQTRNTPFAPPERDYANKRKETVSQLPPSEIFLREKQSVTDKNNFHVKNVLTLFSQLSLIQGINKCINVTFIYSFCLIQDVELNYGA